MPKRNPSQAAGDHAYQAIRTGILNGEYPQGTILAETELATKLGVSRTPIREALQVLLQEELLQPGPRRQLIVGGVSPERRQEILRLRLALEEVSIKEACQRMPDDQLDELRLTLFRQRRVAREVDITTFLELDDHFHLAIAHGTNMPLLERFLEQLRAFVRLMGRDALTRPGRVDQVLAEHEAILEALESRDESAALLALHDHLAATAKSLEG